MVPGDESEVPGPIALALIHAVALHQLESSLVLFDPVASQLVGMNRPLLDPAMLPGVSDARSNMTLFFLMTERYVDDTVVSAVGDGAEQLVLLEAGLGTIFYRRPYPGAHLFEVDRPGAQVWKRRRMADTGVEVPDNLTYVAVDEFAYGLTDSMLAKRYDFSRPSVVIWLKRVQQTKDAIAATYAFLDKHQDNLEVILDYCPPPDLLPRATREIVDPLIRHGENWGSPFLNYFTAEQVAGDLRELALKMVEDLPWRELVERYRPQQLGSPDPLGAHVVRARRLLGK